MEVNICIYSPHRLSPLMQSLPLMNTLPIILIYGAIPLSVHPGCGVPFVQFRIKLRNEKYVFVLGNSVVLHKQY